MANEATVLGSLQINKTNSIQYRSYPTVFRADVDGAVGPSPGAITASVEGTDVAWDAEIDTPGFCWVRNLDPTNFVEVGVWDGIEFHPLLEVGPLEQYPMKLSRNLGNAYGTGTGTLDSGENLRVKADTAPCVVQFDIFKR